jgi:zinc protease
LSDVKSFYQQYYSPSKAKLVIVGDFVEKDLANQLAFLKDWQGKDYRIPDFKEFPNLITNKVLFVDKENAAQSAIRVVRRDLPYDADGEFFYSNLMNFTFGGNFNSRINITLREEKGYTYGARSRFSGGKSLGRFQISTDVKKENTADAINALFTELDRYQAQGMDEKDLKFMRSAYTQSDALDYETPADKAGFLSHLLTFGLSADYRNAQNEVISNVSRDKLNRLATKKMDKDTMALIVVGDLPALTEQLQSVDRQVEVLELAD